MAAEHFRERFSFHGMGLEVTFRMPHFGVCMPFVSERVFEDIVHVEIRVLALGVDLVGKRLHRDFVIDVLLEQSVIDDSENIVVFPAYAGMIQLQPA
ncbi:hypothetical protein [Bifidobacterium vespertilionis]|uniref:hypothetical protein n=1 Tax=Bifidobacterium vespertilionis TaxID=2562524 RepID=UPI001BDC9980|nr:hypothetical protein [Bifidobacterium vespertilionis]MBT1180079.1 hypothetical protein [Bifidobacterium vespertilionis]